MNNNNLPMERSFVNDYKKVLAEYAGKSYDKERFFNSLYVALMSTPKLRECLDTNSGVASLLQAASKAARLGLSVAPDDGEAALVAFNSVVKYQIMTKGYRLLLEETGQVETTSAEVVREGEEITIEKRPEHIEGDLLRHTIDPFSEGEIKGAYAVIILKTGKCYVKAMGLKEIHEHRDASKLYEIDKKKSPWSYAFKGMARKTALKDLLKNTHIPALQNTQELIDENWTPPEPRDVTPQGMAPDEIAGAIAETQKIAEPLNVTPPKGKKPVDKNQPANSVQKDIF